MTKHPRSIYQPGSRVGYLVIGHWVFPVVIGHWVFPWVFGHWSLGVSPGGVHGCQQLVDVVAVVVEVH